MKAQPFVLWLKRFGIVVQGFRRAQVLITKLRSVGLRAHIGAGKPEFEIAALSRNQLHGGSRRWPVYQGRALAVSGGNFVLIITGHDIWSKMVPVKFLNWRILRRSPGTLLRRRPCVYRRCEVQSIGD